jgi:membrane associated rhomboid family serine protease
VTRADLESAVRQFQEPESEVPEEIVARLDFLPRVSVVQEWLQLETAKVLRGQVWRLLTNAFCHDRHGVLHIFVNMLFLFWFGRTIEGMYGSREFLLFYLAAALVASVAYVGLDLATGGSAPAIGASGAVMAVTMIYAIHYPRSVIYIMWIIPIEMRFLIVLYVIFDLHPVLLALAGDRTFTGVAHAAHLGGLAFGFAYWKFNLRLEPFAERLRPPRWKRLLRSRPSLRVVHPVPEDEPPDMDAQVDDILRKIHDQGEASLTDRERQILTTASQRYQKRNQ